MDAALPRSCRLAVGRLQGQNTYHREHNAEANDQQQAALEVPAHVSHHPGRDARPNVSATRAR